MSAVSQAARPRSRRLRSKSRCSAGVRRRLAAAALSFSLLLTAGTALAQGNSANSNGNHGANRADNGRNKIAGDLDKVLNGKGSGREKWVKGSPSGPLLSLVILAN